VRAAISGGQPDSTDSNVFILVSHRGSDEVALCSASLIAPNLLLTARHCVANTTTDAVTCGQTEASAPFPANTFFATNVQNVNDAMSAFSVSSIAVPSQGTDICGFDLALVTLAQVVPSSVAVPLVPRIDKAVARGEIYSAVGYGQDSPGDAGIAGVRMERSGLRVNCAPGVCNSTEAESSEFIGETGICSGDSGGPALDAAGKVVGVVSRSGAQDCASPVYGSVAYWKDWITSVAKQAAVTGNYTAPFWVETGMSDPPAVANPADSGAAGAAAELASSVGVQGDACSAPQDCKTGFGCFAPTGSATGAYCAEFCSAQTKCATGTYCATSVGVCVKGSASADSSSCAFRDVGAPGGSAAGALFGVVALGFAGLRRRRVVRRRATAAG
jgi:hypothetical protein